MLAELEIVPIGTKSASLSALIAKVAELVDASGLDYRVGPMGTVIEGSWDDIMALAKRCHLLLMRSNKRVMTTIRIDDRKDKSGPRMLQKIRSLEKKAGRPFKH